MKQNSLIGEKDSICGEEEDINYTFNFKVMFQNFILKQMLKRQLKDVPQEQQDMIMNIVEKNPDFFMKIAKEVQNKMSTGMSQQQATMTVMKDYQEEIKGMMVK